MQERRLDFRASFDLERTMRRYSLLGYDPSRRIVGGVAWYAFHTPDGAAKIAYRQTSERSVLASAWGPGADHALEAAPRHLGAHDDPGVFEPRDALMRDLHARLGAMRMGGTGRVLERVVPTIIAQKVPGASANRSVRQLVRRYGELAPGPAEPELRLFPTGDVLAPLRYFDFHPLGVERRRAEVIRSVARRAAQLERLAHGDSAPLRARLMAFDGIGPWTTEVVVGGVHGDPDSVPTGDYNLPNLVVFAFTGEPRGDDARMLELLEPYRGQRGRVISYLMSSDISPPRWGPRLSVRDIRGQ